MIAFEEHNETMGKHAHVYLELAKKCDIKNSSWLDIKHEGETFHGNYQAVRNKNAVLRYLMKGNDYMKSEGIHIYSNEQGQLISLEEHTLMVAREKGISHALREYVKYDVKNAVKNFTKIEKNIRHILRIEQQEKQE
jgi:hypothetical protein